MKMGDILINEDSKLKIKILGIHPDGFLIEYLNNKAINYLHISVLNKYFTLYKPKNVKHKLTSIFK